MSRCARVETKHWSMTAGVAAAAVVVVDSEYDLSNVAHVYHAYFLVLRR